MLQTTHDFGRSQTETMTVIEPAFFSSAPGPPYSLRLDLKPDSNNDIFDVNRLKPFFFLNCTP